MCNWTLDVGDGYAMGDVWNTDCGQAWQFETGTPTDNQMRFCCYCGQGPQQVIPPNDDLATTGERGRVRVMTPQQVIEFDDRIRSLRRNARLLEQSPRREAQVEARRNREEADLLERYIQKGR